MSGLAVAAGLMGQFGETAMNVWNRGRMEAREDSAITRRVADMKNAGINPILAAGNPAESKSGAPASIDTTIGQDMLVGQQMKNLKAEGKGLDRMNDLKEQELKDLIQEYDERMRNIQWYKDHKMPSDKPSSLLNDISQALEAWKAGGETGTAIGAAVDTAKAVGGGVKEMTNNMGNTVWKYTPMFMKQSTMKDWKKQGVTEDKARTVLKELGTSDKDTETLINYLRGLK